MPCSYKASEKETKHTTPLSKGGEGSEMPCSYKASEKETKHTTPLSPWRGAGGEAGSGGEAGDVVRPVVGVVYPMLDCFYGVTGVSSTSNKPFSFTTSVSVR